MKQTKNIIISFIYNALYKSSLLLLLLLTRCVDPWTQKLLIPFRPVFGSQDRVARQRPSRFTVEVAESPPVSCNSAHIGIICTNMVDTFCHASVAMQPIFLDNDSFNYKRHGRPVGTRQVHATLAEGRSGTLSCNPPSPGISSFPLSSSSSSSSW